jgi:hypothetical protein
MTNKDQCHRCGFSEECALHAHHVVPSEKSFAISSGNTKALQDLVKEANKCILLCANCHAVIHKYNEEFYFNKNNIPKYIMLDEMLPRTKSIRKCSECNKEISFKSKRCHDCYNNNRGIVKWPPIEELITLVNESNYSQVGKLLGVSDNAVSKRIKKFS